MSVNRKENNGSNQTDLSGKRMAITHAAHLGNITNKKAPEEAGAFLKLSTLNIEI